MIGAKKLSDIRRELWQALGATGGDPIRWLEERMTAPELPRSAAGGESEVLRSLRRFLEAPATKKRRSKRTGARK